MGLNSMRAIAWRWVAIGLLVFGLAWNGGVWYSFSRMPAMLVVLSTQHHFSGPVEWLYGPLYRWVARSVLLATMPTAQDIAEVNAEATVHALGVIEEDALLERVFQRYVERGLDVNARAQTLRHPSQLESAVAVNEARIVRLLLAHGARADIRTSRGLSMLELAQDMQKRHPDRNYSAVMAALER